MNKILKFGLTSNQIEELQIVIKFKSINYEKKFEISFYEYDKIQKEKSETEKKSKELEAKNRQLQKKNQE